VTAAARRPNALDGHRSRRPAVAVRQHCPVNGAERAAVQHGDVRDSQYSAVVGCGGGGVTERRHRRDVVAPPRLADGDDSLQRRGRARRHVM